nr:cupin domain-containing protein [Kineosphaera limosa]
MWRSDDGLLERGVFEADPGAFSFTFGWEEYFVVVAGRATVELSTGQVLELEPGVAGAFFPGDETTWTIHETFRKGFHCDLRAV